MYYDLILWEEIEPSEINEKLRGKAVEMVKRFQGYGLVHYNMRTEIPQQTQQVQQYATEEEYEEEEQTVQPQQQPPQRMQQRPPQPPEQQQRRTKPIDPDEVLPQEPDIDEDEIEDEM